MSPLEIKKELYIHVYKHLFSQVKDMFEQKDVHLNIIGKNRQMIFHYYQTI